MSHTCLPISFCHNVQQSTVISLSAFFLLLSPAFLQGVISPKHKKGYCFISLHLPSPLSPPCQISEKVQLTLLHRPCSQHFDTEPFKSLRHLLVRKRKHDCIPAEPGCPAEVWEGEGPPREESFLLSSHRKSAPPSEGHSSFSTIAFFPGNTLQTQGEPQSYDQKVFLPQSSTAGYLIKRDGLHLGWRGKVRDRKARYRHTLWKR